MSPGVGDSQISLIECRRHLISGIQLAVSGSEFSFSRYCALKRTGTFASENKVKLTYVFIYTDDVLMFNSWNQTVSEIILRLRKVEFFK